MCKHSVFTNKTCVHSRTFLASKSFAAAVREAFSNAFPGKEVPNKTPTGNNIWGYRKCLRQVTCPASNSVDR
jgi:hypothetical protein